MTRFTLAAVTALMLAAAPVVAQTTPAQAPVQRTTPQQTIAPSAPASSPTPGSEEWLRLRGESYSAAPEVEQDPTEVAETIRLNAGIAARNEAAERREIEGTAAWQAEDARWCAEVARLKRSAPSGRQTPPPPRPPAFGTSANAPPGPPRSPLANARLDPV